MSLRNNGLAECLRDLTSAPADETGTDAIGSAVLEALQEIDAARVNVGAPTVAPAISGISIRVAGTAAPAISGISIRVAGVAAPAIGGISIRLAGTPVARRSR